MKHLRRFDESLKDELQDFCDTHLAYLIDEGFKVRIYRRVRILGFRGFRVSV
jgi:hypothetical protein